MDIVNLSTENQILSNKTAFVCEICELEDQFKITLKVIYSQQLKIQYRRIKMNYSYSHEERIMKSCSPANFVQPQEQAQPFCFSRQSAMPNIFFSNQAMLPQAPSFQENLSKKQCQLSEQKKKDVENDKLSFQLLIQFAQADGSFKISNVIQLKINFNNLNKEQGLKEEVWNTLLILLYLEKHCSEDKKSWQLVFSKGIVFLYKNGINYMEKKKEYENLLV